MKGGAIAHFAPKWKSLTSDKFIIDIVLHGLRIKFYSSPKGNNPVSFPTSKTETEAIGK